MRSKRIPQRRRAPSPEQQSLIDGLLQDRADLSRWSVLGDLLQTEGDPRGELVSLMVARERHPSKELFDAEHRYRQKYGAELVRELGLDAERLAWRRGFPSQVRATSIDTLKAITRDPSMRFLDRVTLELEGNAWPRWLAILVKHPLHCPEIALTLRRSESAIVLAPLLEAVPRLERLRVSFLEGHGELDWVDACSNQLKQLALRNVDEVGSLEQADLSALEDLRVFDSYGMDDLRDADVWARLKCVVSDELSFDDESGDHADGPEVRGYYAGEERSYLTAFLVVVRPIDLELVRELVSRISGIDYLAARLARLSCCAPMTAISLRGVGATLMPYGLARALETHLGTSVAMFAMDNERLRSSVLGPEPIAREEALNHPDPRMRPSPSVLVRNVLDLAFGYDPGPDALGMIVEELGCAREVPVVGPTIHRGHRLGGLEVLTDIDPITKPITPDLAFEAENFDFDFMALDHDDVVEHERDLRTDHYPWEAPELDEPEREATIEAVSFELPDVDEPTPPEHDEPAQQLWIADDQAVTKPLVETSDGVDAWSRLNEIWDAQECDPDAETVEARWPDPEQSWIAIVDASTLQDTDCFDCASWGPLRRCSVCWRRYCIACSVDDEREVILCTQCVSDFIWETLAPFAPEQEIYEPE
ncbi:MAG: hypothetical protein AB7L28_04090 [Kofleriaceae bacterium]